MENNKYVVYENKSNGLRFMTTYNPNISYVDSDELHVVETNITDEIANKLCDEKEDESINAYLNSLPDELRSSVTDLSMDNSFEKELELLLNKHSIENKSDTPDFILAEYIGNALNAFNDATNLREKWYETKNRQHHNHNKVDFNLGYNITGYIGTHNTLTLPDNARKEDKVKHNYTGN